MIRLTASFLAASLLPAPAAMAENGNAPILIAVAGPMTGPFASQGHDMQAGAMTAAAEINKNGGILGRPLSLEFADDACEPRQALAIANKIASENISYVLGHFCSGSTMPASAIYDENGIVQITLSQSPAILQQNFDRLFRITPNAQVLAAAYMDSVEAAAKAGKSRIALIGTNDEYAKSIADGLEEQLKARSMDLVLRDFYAPLENDYSAVISRMKYGQIDLVLVAGTEKEMGMIVRQSADMGFKPEFILSSTAASADFPLIAGCAAQGVKVVAAWNPLYTPGHEDLHAALRENGANGIDTAFNAYAGIMAIAQGLRGTGADNPEKLADYLHKNAIFLPIGETRFDSRGELRHPRAITYEYQSVDYPCTRVEMIPASP